MVSYYKYEDFIFEINSSIGIYASVAAHGFIDEKIGIFISLVSKLIIVLFGF